MRPVMIEAVGEGIDEGLQILETVREVVGGIELIAP